MMYVSSHCVYKYPCFFSVICMVCYVVDAQNISSMDNYISNFRETNSEIERGS